MVPLEWTDEAQREREMGGGGGRERERERKGEREKERKRERGRERVPTYLSIHPLTHSGTHTHCHTLVTFTCDFVFGGHRVKGKAARIWSTVSTI